MQPAPALALTELAAHPPARPVVGPLSRHPAATYLARLAPSSRRVMRGALDAIAHILTGQRCDALTLDWRRLRYEHTTALRAVLADGWYAPTTANRHLAALRGVLRECWRLGSIGVEDYQRAAILSRCAAADCCAAAPWTAARSKPCLTSVATMHTRRSASAMRRSWPCCTAPACGEPMRLDLGDYDRRKGTLKVRGKGNKDRLAYVGAGGRAAIDDWLVLRGATPGPFFWPVHHSGRIGQARRLTAQAVLHIARRRGADAHIGAFSPHDLRRSFVSDLLDAGVDLSMVQQMAGHAQVQTTARYDRRGDEAKAEAAMQLQVPYRRRRQGLVA